MCVCVISALIFNHDKSICAIVIFASCCWFTQAENPHCWHPTRVQAPLSFHDPCDAEICGAVPKFKTLHAWEHCHPESKLIRKIPTSMDQWFGRLWQPTNLQMGGGTSKMVKFSAFFWLRTNKTCPSFRRHPDVGNYHITNNAYKCLKIVLLDGILTATTYRPTYACPPTCIRKRRRHPHLLPTVHPYHVGVAKRDRVVWKTPCCSWRACVFVP